MLKGHHSKQSKIWAIIRLYHGLEKGERDRITDLDVASFKVKLNQYILRTLILIPTFSLTLDIRIDLTHGRNINSIIKGRYRFSELLQKSLSSPPKNPIFSEKKIIQFQLWETRTLHLCYIQSHTKFDITSGRCKRKPWAFCYYSVRRIRLGCVETKKIYILHTLIELVILHVRTATKNWETEYVRVQLDICFHILTSFRSFFPYIQWTVWLSKEV